MKSAGPTRAGIAVRAFVFLIVMPFALCIAFVGVSMVYVALK